MTYCEQKLRKIYLNFTFSSGVYAHDGRLLKLLYLNVLKHLDDQIKSLKEAKFSNGELTFYGNHYRRLMTQYYNFYQGMA